MRHVEDWFLIQEKKLAWTRSEETSIPRRIYLATDDTAVSEALRKKFVHFIKNLNGILSK